MNRPTAGALVALLVLVAAPPTAAQDEPLFRARTLYNSGSYDAAILAASVARDAPVTANAARLVLARAYLERYRRDEAAEDLAAARDELTGLDPAALTARERVEYEIGVAEALFLEGTFGAAAEVFGGLLRRAVLVGPQAADRVLDWWATALDREAQARAPGQRDQIYRRLLTQMEDELARDAASVPASYWIAAAARALGRLDRAWDAAVAAWVRAPLARERGELLRADIDRLVTEALVPERARRYASEGPAAGPPRAVEDVAASLLDEWQAVKDRWASPSLPSSSVRSRRPR